MTPRAKFPATQPEPITVGRELPAISVSPGTIESCDFLDAESVDAIAVGVGAPIAGDDELQPRAGTVHASARYRIDLAELAHRSHFKAAPGTTHVIDLPVTHRGSGAVLPWQGLPLRIILMGVGQGTDDDLRKAGAALAEVSKGLGKVVTTVAARSDDRGTRHFVEGYLLGAYSSWSRKAKAAPVPAQELVLLGPNSQEAVDTARRHAWLTWIARDLATIPSNIKTPAWLASQFVAIAKTYGVEAKTWSGKQLKDQGFGGVEAVGQGSVNPPVMVQLSYVPEKKAKDHKHVVLVGKGISFDTGGISIKRPRETMITMKTDMTGAADAFAAVIGAATSKIGHSVTAMLPLAENHFGANSTRPSDVITIFGGKTVEIANTDAEGRVVMADALAYGSLELGADLLIDVATLTGAAAMSLGHSHAALFTNNEDLSKRFLEAAEETGEALWRMPLVHEYSEALESQVADLRNIPEHAAGAGAVVAALFLEQFANGLPWVHLDIAGPSHRNSKHHEANKGPTGFGARVVLEVLEKL
ncbi:leucyl aminopeptidase family protein [Timonella senegalensis]|uniref:leucyl aminopeptidase family protein n=1 Tax=Timonella senegalensis TaxID=1465825 RepID=UPI0002DF184E|nr:leucyl aminopeptidase family protein [Timonella senegalensis]